MTVDLRRWSRGGGGARTASACVVGAAAFAAVHERTASRIVVTSDTLVINGQAPVLAGAKLLNASGHAIWHGRLHYGNLPTSIARASGDGSVRCTGSGDATLTVSHGALRRDVVIRCRPIARFGFADAHVTLELGGPPQEMLIDAQDSDHRPVDLLRGEATIRDTAVAQLRGTHVYPRAIGRTWIDVRFAGGPRTVLVVTVERPAAAAVLSMVGGQFQTWHLEPGYYRVQLETADSTRSPPWLVLGAINSNCAEGHGPQEYYCITKDNSAFVVRNVAAAGSRPAQLGRFTAVQIPRY